MTLDCWAIGWLHCRPIVAIVNIRRQFELILVFLSSLIYQECFLKLTLMQLLSGLNSLVVWDDIKVNDQLKGGLLCLA